MDATQKKMVQLHKEWFGSSSEINSKPFSKKSQQEAPVKAIQLKLFRNNENPKAAMPNAISRSALFACVHPGRRKMHEKTLIASRKDITIKYTGKQLDMSDSDVLYQTYRTIERLNLGENILFCPYAFLREMGRCTGKGDKKWLEKAFDRLTSGTVTIKVPGKYTAHLHLVDSYIHNIETDTYYIRVNKEAIKLFNNMQFGLIDWEIRKKLKKPLAKWLQTYAASNKKNLTQEVLFSNLKKWCGQGHRRMDHFEKTLGEAVNELKEAGIIVKVNLDTKAKKLTFIMPKTRDPKVVD